MLNKIKKNLPYAIPYVLFAVMVIVGTVAPAQAADALSDVAEDIIGYIGRIFRVVGVFLIAFSAGQLILAMKNEDADSKSRASTQLAVGAVLLVVPTIIDNLKLTQYLNITSN